MLKRTHDHCCIAHSTRDRRDPTKTTVVRAKYERALVRRFQLVKKQIREKIVTQNAFGMVTNAGEFDFPTKTAKVRGFMSWLDRMVEEGVLERTSGMPMDRAANQSWQNVYLRSAYQKGLAGAAQSMRRDGVEVSDRWIDEGFYRPVHADAVGLIYTRAYSDLEGITKAMDTRISRTLAEGMASGWGMDRIADSLDDAVDGIGIVRARMLARTETIRAHAEATLNTYEEAGVEGVEVMSEFTTAGDDHVCPKCEALEGKQYSLEDARGIIPVHPNCRCAWLPVVVDPKGKKLL